MSFYDTKINNEITLCGLEKWTNYLYEQLGWVTLNYKNNQFDKVNSYLISIKKLILSIESRLKIVTNEDSKIDLTILLEHSNHLNNLVLKLFDKELINKINNHEGGSKNKKNKILLKKSSKKSSKELFKKIYNKPLIKKLSKTQSKKSSKILSKKHKNI